MEHDSSLHKQMRKKIKGSPFSFTESIEKQKEDNEIDLGLYFELAEENEIIYNQTLVNTLLEDMENLRNGFFTNVYFSLGDKREIDTFDFLKIVMT